MVYIPEPAVTLASATSYTATAGTGSEQTFGPPVGGGYVFVLHIADYATATGMSWDFYVQTKCDGTNWVDVVHFPTLLSSGTTTAPSQQYEVIGCATTAGGGQPGFTSTQALGAGTVRNVLGTSWRFRYTRTGLATVTATASIGLKASARASI